MGISAVRPYWKPILALVIPLALLPLTLVFEDHVNAGRCGFVMLVMGFYWVLELIPIPITGLLPAILFPLLGIEKAKEVCKNYFQDSVMLFVGGLLVALAVEETNLHKRIALRVLLLVGAKPYWIMAGFMGISAGLSMFISNTATTAMILPIAVAVIMELNRQRQSIQQARSTLEMSVIRSSPSSDVDNRTTDDTKSMSMMTSSSTANIIDVAEKAEAAAENAQASAVAEFKTLSPRQQEISKALVLSVAYASSIGGMATLTGTLTNVVFIGQFQKRYNTTEASDAVTYASFSFFAFPTMIMCLIFTWCWLTFQFFVIPYLRTRKSESDPEMERQMIRMFNVKYDELGPMRFSEGSALFIFVVLVLLWFFRAPGFMPGWEIAFKKEYISDATPAILMGIILFLWPKKLSWWMPANGFTRLKYEAIMNWKVVARKFPWDVVLLLGGALALAEGVESSGLTGILKSQMQLLRSIPPVVVCLVTALLVTFCTEFASNAAIASIFLPVVAEMAEAFNIHPLYYMLPVTISCSFAFMFPVATPPNAIVFSSGFLKVFDMVKAGFVLNIACMGILIGSIHTFGEWVFDLSHYPEWALTSDAGTNTTLAPALVSTLASAITS